MEERLWDLVFEWRLYTAFRVPADFEARPPEGRLERIRHKIRELSERVFGREYEPQIMAEAHHNLHSFLLPRPQA